MRSAVAAGLLVLAGCDGGKKENLLETVMAEASEAASDDAGAATGTAKPSPAALAEKHFLALGTEPFWSVDVLPGKLRFSSPEDLEGTTFATVETKIGKGARYSGMMDGKAISLVIEPGQCNDGMSDTVYEWKASLTIDGKTEQGCARLK